MSDTYARIYAVVRKIPRGRVATYGQIAAIAGLKGHAREVGYALYALKSSTAVPWQRVINAQGLISLRPTTGGFSQRMLLEREGIVFDAAGRVSLRKFGWRPSASAKTRTRVRRGAG